MGGGALQRSTFLVAVDVKPRHPPVEKSGRAQTETDGEAEDGGQPAEENDGDAAIVPEANGRDSCGRDPGEEDEEVEHLNAPVEDCLMASHGVVWTHAGN